MRKLRSPERLDNIPKVTQAVNLPLQTQYFFMVWVYTGSFKLCPERAISLPWGSWLRISPLKESRHLVCYFPDETGQDKDKQSLFQGRVTAGEGLQLASFRKEIR